jgi:hypothetical protein
MKRAIGAALALLLLALLVQPRALAQTTGWGDPQHIASPLAANWFPSVAVDPWGVAHMIWSTGKEEGKISKSLVMYTRLKDGAWSAPNDILWPGSAAYAARNSLAVDRSGRLHALVRSRDAIWYISAPAATAQSAQAWTTPHKIDGTGQSYYEAIAVDASGVIHVVWQDAIGAVNEGGCADCANVWYRRSTDGGRVWSKPANLSHGPHGAGKLQIAFDPRNNPYVVWSEGSDPFQGKETPIAVAFAYSDDHGQSWQEPRRLTLPNDAPQQATLAVDGRDQLVMVFRATGADALLFSRSDDRGRTWTPAEPVPGLIARRWDETPWDAYSIVADSAGNLHLLVAGRINEAQTIPALYHVTWRGQEQRWEPPEIVSQNELRPEWPQATIAAGNQLHVVWFTRSAQDLLTPEKPNYQVWYSARTLDAPARPVAVVPTSTPPPTETPVPTPTSAPAAPLPPTALDAPAAPSLRSELPLLRMVGLALTPLLILLALIAGAALAQRATRRSPQRRTPPGRPPW